MLNKLLDKSDFLDYQVGKFGTSFANSPHLSFAFKNQQIY